MRAAPGLCRRLLLLVLLCAGCGGPGVRGDAALERMVNQPKDEPYDREPFFADGSAMRPLPPGTVPEERPLGPRPLVEGVGDDGAPVDRFPLTVTRPLVERGRERFGIYCAACHGLLGDGESVVAHNMPLRKPPNLLEDKVRRMPVGRLFQVITGGYGLMPSYAPQLSVEERWGVIAYLRALQRSQGVPIVDLPVPLRDEAQKALQ